MAIFDWDSSFETGLDVIDFQHKILFSRLVELEKAILKNESKNKINHILSDLISYSLYHIKTEEDFFLNFDYKEKENHEKEHQFCKDYIYYITKNFIKNDEKLNITEVLELKERIFEHIKFLDKEFVNELKEHLQ